MTQTGKEELTTLEYEQQFDKDSNDVPPLDIVAFNELRSCADLLRLYQSEQLNIKPDFQREVVWSKSDQTRFIDSLTKQLPIPSMCFSLDYRTEQRLVIDGLQRIQSIINFLSNDSWALSELADIDERISGKTVAEIKTNSMELFARVQNVMIPITIIRCDNSKKDHNEYLFTIFSRLNSGGVKLNNQEIRNCIYNGSFNTLLKDLAQNDLSKKLIGIKGRFLVEEMILRFFAFNDALETYTGRLSVFLNDYMFEKRNLSMEEADTKIGNYISVITFINEKIFNSESIPTLSKSFLEGLLYGVSQNLSSLSILGGDEVKEIYSQFQSLPEFSVDNLKEGLSAKSKVLDRLAASKRCFAN